MKPMLFVDVETTGLDSEKCGIVEIAAVLVNREFKLMGLPIALPDKVKSGEPTNGSFAFYRRCYPHNGARIEVKALELNGYSDKISETFDFMYCSEQEALQDFSNFCACIAKHHGRVLFCGHNPRFDYEFLKAGFGRYELIGPYADHHLVDTASMALPLYLAGRIENLRLATLCEYFKTVVRPRHTAIHDVLATVDLARNLDRQFNLPLGNPLAIELVKNDLVEGEVVK